jgi:hypothetical protein
VKTIGRPGRGPGEFRIISALGLVDSVLVVFDIGNSRVTHVSLSSERIIHEHPLPIRPSYLALLPNHTLVLNAVRPSRDMAGQPFHVVDPLGIVLRSFGYDGDTYRMDIPFQIERHLATRTAESFWAAYVNRYAIEAWSVTGRRIARFERNVSWFRPQVTQPPTSREDPPQPLLEALRQDAAGNLWVLIRVADNAWTRGIRADSAAPHGFAIERHKYYDTVIEVIDPRTATLSASLRIDPHAYTFVGENLIAVDEEAPDGSPRIAVFHLAVKRN